MAPGGPAAGTADNDDAAAQIDDKETEHAEYDHGRGKAHEASGRAAAAFDGIRDVRIEPVDGDVHRAVSSNPIAKQRAANARRHEIVALRRGKDDFRRISKKPSAFHADALVQWKEKRRAQSKP